MKPRMTAQDYRHKHKLRMKKFREEQEKKGYKSVSIFLSQELRDELERLSKEMDISKQAAMDHIFATYKNIPKNITCDEVEKESKDPETSTTIADKQNQIDSLQNSIAEMQKKIDFLWKGRTIKHPNKENELFPEAVEKVAGEDSHSGSDQSPPADQPMLEFEDETAATIDPETPGIDASEDNQSLSDTIKPGSKGHRQQLINCICECGGNYCGDMSHAKLAEEFDRRGIPMLSGGKWSKLTKGKVKKAITAFIDKHEEKIRTTMLEFEYKKEVQALSQTDDSSAQINQIGNKGPEVIVINKKRAKEEIRPFGDESADIDEIPCLETDKAAYRSYVIDLMKHLKAEGLTHKQIKYELENSALKTFSGLDTWSEGTIGKLINPPKKKAADAEPSNIDASTPDELEEADTHSDDQNLSGSPKTLSTADLDVVVLQVAEDIPRNHQECADHLNSEGTLKPVRGGEPEQWTAVKFRQYLSNAKTRRRKSENLK